MNKRRRILHVDMDAFFAAVELKRHPELRGKPVVVGGRGDPQSRGVVSTATYEARAFGIHSGMVLRLAWRLCPEAISMGATQSDYKYIKSIIYRLFLTLIVNIRTETHFSILVNFSLAQSL